jgi:hypothetical protein
MFNLLGLGGSPQVDEIAASHQAQKDIHIDSMFDHFNARMVDLENRITKLERQPDVPQQPKDLTDEG